MKISTWIDSVSIPTIAFDMQRIETIFRGQSPNTVTIFTCGILLLLSQRLSVLAHSNCRYASKENRLLHITKQNIKRFTPYIVTNFSLDKAEGTAQ